MILSLPYEEFKDYVLRQMNHYFPDNQNLTAKEYDQVFSIAIERTSYCFSHIKMNSYSSDGETYLNHLHANQYAIFLWFLSNTVWVEFRNEVVANKLYCLNRTLNSLSCSYEAKLPRIFLLLHIVGTVLGKAEYSDFFVACHGCTVGAHHGIYPNIGRGVAMLPHSSIIGACDIGDRVSLGINTTAYEQDIPDNTTLYIDSATGRTHSKESLQSWAQHLFNVEI
jgi:serine O-acetyltransferase